MSDPQSSRDTGKARLFQRAADAVGRTRLGRKLLARLSKNTTLQRLTIGGPNPMHLWEDDGTFLALAGAARPLTLLTDEAMFNLYQIGRQVESVAGDVAEVGVYKGGTAVLLAQQFQPAGKHLFLFDTFAGMPESADERVDRHQAGDFDDTSLEAVTRALSRWDTVELCPGLFPGTAGAVEDRTFALVHVDVDIFQSVSDCCEFFYPRLTTGGALVFDDYGQRSCPGARKAVDEFFADKPEHPFYLPTGQCVVWRLP
ncbi:MAG: TylF/MycF/NovP-related O-methyltransferase [Actinomycetota bacterium]